MKFGRIKRQHGRIGGLDDLLNRIVRECPYVSRIVPGRISVRRGKTPSQFKIQYPTPAGLKCLYTSTGTVQEVFLICKDLAAAQQWLVEQGIADAVKQPSTRAEGRAVGSGESGRGQRPGSPPTKQAGARP